MKQFNWNNPYPTIRIPVFARNVVSTSHPLAAQAGLRMLLKGGSAVDAVIAAAATDPEHHDPLVPSWLATRERVGERLVEAYERAITTRARRR